MQQTVCVSYKKMSLAIGKEQQQFHFCFWAQTQVELCFFSKKITPDFQRLAKGEKYAVFRRYFPVFL